MSQHPIYELAAEENARAAAILREVLPDAFAAYLRSREAMEAYKGVPNPSDVMSDEVRNRARVMGETLAKHNLARLPMPRAHSEAARVITSAELYLKGQGARRSSRQIAEALLHAGIDIGGGNIEAKISRVSAHLSASAKFNNDRAEGGYGLAVWPVSSNAASL